ncbi:MAG TPA: hypothetical protein VLG68_05690 [Gammaproteobacteria bacterium]|nr:hypothetical protein [Gammaproteobacteria bacterium]
MTRRLLLLALSACSLFNACAADDKTATRLADLKIGGGEIQVDELAGSYAVTRDETVHWVETAARAVTHYYGRFPVAHLHLLIEPRNGRGRASGTTYGSEDGGFIRIGLGTMATAADLKDDWVMTHEMVHLAFPQMEDEHHWIEEGLATYVEPLARAEIGELTPEYVWKETVEGMPNGLPAAGDRGLDKTPTWGRTYWGGALFCLLADVEIRERTHDRYGLRDALEGILKAGGNIQTTADIEYAFKTGDEAVGVPVLTELYTQMKGTPVTTDLDALWKKLGVIYKDGATSFDDKAPDAAIRKAMTAAD